MFRFLKFFAIAVLSLPLLAPAASAQRGGGGRGFGGGGFRGRGFGAGFRGGWGGWGGGYFGPGWGWYNPYWYGWGWGYPYVYGYRYPYAYGYAQGGDTGNVKIDKAAKDDAVYVDGGYAGTVDQLGKFKLRLGNHDVEVRDPGGRTVVHESIEIIPGKTVEIHPDTGGR